MGCTIFVANDAEVATNCESVMERLQRSEVSNPPAFGAKVASQILNDPSLTKMWYNDLLTMNGRISQMRKSLHDALIRNGELTETLTETQTEINCRCAWRLVAYHQSIWHVQLPWAATANCVEAQRYVNRRFPLLSADPRQSSIMYTWQRTPESQ